MTMRSVRTCDVCCKDRTDNVEVAVQVDYADARTQEEPVTLVWVHVGTTMCGVVTCTKKACIDATIACCDRFVTANNIIPLDGWLDLSGDISWWRESKRWIQTGNFEQHCRSPGVCTTMADAACPTVFSHHTDRPITTSLRRKNHAGRAVRLRDILKATPRLRRMAILELKRPPDHRRGRDALQREVDASAPPNLLRGAVVLYLGTADGDDLYAVQDDSQPFVPAELAGLGYNNVALVGRIEDGTAISRARMLYKC